MKIYVAGPMTGYPNFNRAAFNKEAKKLQAYGHIVLNPAILPDGLSECEYMDIGMMMLRASDAILMLPGWQQSAGASVEYHYAYKTEKRIFTTLNYPPVEQAN